MRFLAVFSVWLSKHLTLCRRPGWVGSQIPNELNRQLVGTLAAYWGGKMKTTKTEWTPTKLDDGQYLGPIEFQDNKGEWHTFEIMRASVPSDRICFGGPCNVGFLESGFIRVEDGEHPDETLAEMVADLQTYYNDGPQSVSGIVCNERM